MATTPKQRYSVTISLRKEDWEQLCSLQKHGIHVVDILRIGMARITKEKMKAKKL